MMKRKEVINVLKFLGVLFVFALGFITVVASGGDDAKDIVEDIVGPQTTDETLELPEVTLEKSAEVQQLTITGSGVSQFTGSETDYCKETSTQTELNNIEGSEDWLDYITEVNVIDLAASVTVSGVTITAEEGSTMYCSLTITGSGVSQFADSETYPLVKEYPISGEIGPDPETLYLSDDTASSIIDWYLNQGRSDSFEYCLECTGDDDFSNYTVTFAPIADIEVTFEP